MVMGGDPSHHGPSGVALRGRPFQDVDRSTRAPVQTGDFSGAILGIGSYSFGV